MTTIAHEPSIKCGKCGQKHHSVEAVKACYFKPTLLPLRCETFCNHNAHNYNGGWCSGQAISTGATPRQIEYMVTLGMDEELARHYTLKGASTAIDRLKRENKEKERMSDPITSAPNRIKTKIPLSFLQDLRDGYYAARPDDTKPYTFFRVSRPKSGQYKGSVKIQTQHGPDLNLAMVIWSFEGDGRLTIYNKAVEDDLLLVVVDQRGCAMAYAEKLGKCCRCNTELTDDRSRWYGIGPECEKHWPWMIDEINDTKGVYRPGSGH